MTEQNRPLLPLVLDRVPPGLRQALLQEGVPFVERRPGRADGRFLLFDSKSGRPRDLASDQVAIDVHTLRSGWRGDAFEDILDERAGRFRWRIDEFTISDEIARVDKRSVRAHLMNGLRARLESEGGVWFCVGAYPFPYRSAFHLRLDHDAYDPDDFDGLLQGIAGNEHATSHFVCVAAHEPHPEAVARMRGLDVGTQGYLRHSYQDNDDNLRNIRRGIEGLQKLGVEPVGFAAPHGRFSRGTLTALESLGVTHSSEVGLAHDELPFFPGGGQVLQIPVHPVTLGLFLESAAQRSRDSRPIGDDSKAAASGGRLWFEQVTGSDSSIRRLGLLEGHRGVLNTSQEEAVGAEQIANAVDRARSYFRNFATAQYQAGEPIVIYSHCNGRAGRHPRLLKSLFDTVAEMSACWSTTMTGLNSWWRARASVKLRVLAVDGGYQVIIDHAPKGYRLCGELSRGEHVARVPLDQAMIRLASDSLAFEQRRPTTRNLPVRIDSAHGLKEIARRYRASSPTSDDNGDPRWRGWLGRALRRMKE